MSIIAKLLTGTALVAATAVIGVYAVQPQSFSPTSSFQALAPLSVLSGFVNITATTPLAAAGPIDRAFTAKRVHLDKIVGQVELITSQPGTMRVQAWGKQETLKELQVRVIGDELYIRLDKHEEEAWFPWNIFNMWAAERKPADLKLRVTAPIGTPYEIEEHMGSLNAGDLDAPVTLETHSTTARFGRVQSAKVSIAGSGRVMFGTVKEQLDIEIAGSGHFEAQSATSVQVEIAGGGEVVLGTIAKGLDIEVAGSGDVRAASINGPLDVEIAGSGDVMIGGGTATSFQVEIAGSGDVVFKGHAINPSVDIMGSGSITVGSYSGTLDKDIAGSGDFNVLKQAPNADQPTTPVPPAPPSN